MLLVSERMTLVRQIGNSIALSLIMDPRFAGEESHLAGNAPRSIVQLCSIYGKAKCEDPRDRVFGLLGIASSCCSRAIQVDYSSTLPEVAQAVLLHHIYDHRDGTQSALENAIDFHQSLGITPIDYEPPPRSSSQILRIKGDPRADSRIITSLELVDYGPLKYISPALDGSVNLERCRIPALPARLERTLDTLLKRKVSALMDKKSLWSRITMDLDLVLPLDHSTNCKFLLPYQVPELPLRIKDSDIPDIDPILFRKLLLECQAALAPISQPNNQRLAFAESGSIFLVPENVRTGDLTYRVVNRNDLFIVRPRKLHSRSCYPVARSVFNLWTYRLDLGPPLGCAQLELDLYTLQMMSVTSSFHREQAEDEDQNIMEATGLQ
jgi:hypothetical protein